MKSTSLILFFLVLTCNNSFSESPKSMYELFESGTTYTGRDYNNRECIVQTGSLYPALSRIEIKRSDCGEDNTCSQFRGREFFSAGGGCTHHLSKNLYEVHLSNGPTPQAAPSFCTPRRATPGGVRVLIYPNSYEVQILDGHGSLKDRCILTK